MLSSVLYAEKFHYTLQGTAFTLKERQIMGIHGLLPPVVFTIEQQAKRILANVRRWESDLDKYIYLIGLQVSPYSKHLSKALSDTSPISKAKTRNTLFIEYNQKFHFHSVL